MYSPGDTDSLNLGFLGFGIEGSELGGPQTKVVEQTLGFEAAAFQDPGTKSYRRLSNKAFTNLRSPLQLQSWPSRPLPVHRAEGPSAS